MKLGEVQQVLQLLLREERADSPVGSHSGDAGRLCAADQGPDLAGGMRPPAVGPHDLHALPRSGRPAARRDARSGVGGADSGGLRAQRRRAADSPLARDVDERLPSDRRRSREACRCRLAANRAGAPQIRPALKQLTAAHIPQLVVLSYNEITRDTRIESAAMISEAGSWQSAAERGAPSPHFRGVAAAAKLT